MTTEQQLREALEYIRYLCKPGYDSVDNMTAEEVIDRCHHEAVGALALPSQRPDDEGVDEAKLLHLISSELLIVDFDDARKQADNLLAAKQDAKRIYEKIRPYLRAKPDAELVEKLHSAIKDASSEFERGENNGLRHAVEIARQHTCAGDDNKELKRLMEKANREIAAAGGPYDVSLLKGCAGAGKSVVDEEALAKAAYDAVLRIRESEDAPGFDICLKAEMDNRRPIIETYVAALAQWKVSV